MGALMHWRNWGHFRPSILSINPNSQTIAGFWYCHWGRPGTHRSSLSVWFPRNPKENSLYFLVAPLHFLSNQTEHLIADSLCRNAIFKCEHPFGPKAKNRQLKNCSFQINWSLPINQWFWVQLVGFGWLGLCQDIWEFIGVCVFQRFLISVSFQVPLSIFGLIRMFRLVILSLIVF